MKRFKKIHLIIILACSIALTPPAQATYQDSIILQYLVTQFNYIMKQVNKVGFALQHLTKQLGNMSLTNAHKQAAEVQGGVIAENTKTLGKLKYQLEFGGTIANASRNGRTFWASAVSSVGCALKDHNEQLKEAEKNTDALKSTMSRREDDLKISAGSMESQRKEANRRAKDYINKAKTPVLAPSNNISESDAFIAAEAIATVVNKRMLPEVHGHSGREPGGMSTVDYYRQLTQTISNIATNNYSKGVSLSGGGSVANNFKAISGMRMTENYIAANNLKTGKGASFDLVEGNYSLLLLKLEQLEELRQQEKLHSIRALAALRKFHKENP